MRGKVLVTGASGFLGSGLCNHLDAVDFIVSGAVRGPIDDRGGLADQVVVGEINGQTDWGGVLAGGFDAIVHCAARVHIMHDAAVDPLAKFRHVNVDGTLRLARKAAMSGVRRFVFVSSIGVCGSESVVRPYNEDDVAPHSPYALSKYEAEQGLLEIAHETGMEVVIVRPPLVYGPNAPGNFASLIRLAYMGIPLPLGAVRNLRSFVALDNLIDLIMLCVEHSSAANEVFVVSDGEDLSTPELLTRLGAALGRPPHMFPVPVGWMRGLARIVGKMDTADSLFGSLQVDSSKARKLLGWKPVVSVDEGLQKAADAFLALRASR